jgi:serine/threonine protein kinase
VADIPSISALIERAVGAGVPANAEQISMAVNELTAELPTPIDYAMRTILARIGRLPITAAAEAEAIPLGKRRAVLPDWLLPRRTIGSFYVVRALGSGGVSSVFMARRFEERHNPHAEAFALKVPHYDPTTARSLSEQEFFELFRDEAGALLSLPQHPNLARFVTFDLAARPKPILVMELIEGIGLDRLIRGRTLETGRALDYLDGMLAGLEAMHGAGVGHLDVKPSNVILRGGETPVLVDFGLSGRHLRPGCGTLEYCAPEVLGVVPRGVTPAPSSADMYSFACLAFELLTSSMLFDADDEMRLMSMQVSHDGWPDKLMAFGGQVEYAELSVILAACLRRDPRQRPTAAETRAALVSIRSRLADYPWPLELRRQRTA